MNLGALMDPIARTRGTPAGFEGGFDLDQLLDNAGMWSLTGWSLGGVRARRTTPTSSPATAGFTYHATAMLDLSIVGLVGMTRGSDRGGVLTRHLAEVPPW
jgi:hypothetical protein